MGQSQLQRASRLVRVYPKYPVLHTSFVCPVLSSASILYKPVRWESELDSHGRVIGICVIGKLRWGPNAYWGNAHTKPAPYQKESLGKCRKVKLTGMDMFHATLNLESESFARGPYRQLRSACGAMHRGNLGNVFASGGPFMWLASCWFLNRPQNLPEFDTSIIECITQVAYNPQNPFEPQRASFFLGANRRFFDVRLQNP